MKIGNNYLIVSAPSIFVSRAGKVDVTVWRREGRCVGAKMGDGQYYQSVAKFCAETAECLRSYAPLPPEITLPLLRQWGFIGG